MKALAALLLFSLSAPDAVRAEDGEKAVLERVIQLAREGRLGIDIPEGWTWEYRPVYGACMQLLTTSCALIEDMAPIEERAYVQPVWAVTQRSTRHTIFYIGSASARAPEALALIKPEHDENTVTFLAPQPFTAMEMAAYVLGHEVQGHLVHELNGESVNEMRGNYLGYAAVKRLREPTVAGL